MALRSVRERVIQTLAYELGGLLLATPAYALVFGSSTVESLALILAMSIAMVLWSPLHNTLFDFLDLKLSGRVASDRPHCWRMVHAASHEATSIVITLPVIMVMGGHGFWEAIMIDIGFTLFYGAYAYLFHCAFDWARPVQSG